MLYVIGKWLKNFKSECDMIDKYIDDSLILVVLMTAYDVLPFKIDAMGYSDL